MQSCPSGFKILKLDSEFDVNPEKDHLNLCEITLFEDLGPVAQSTLSFLLKYDTLGLISP